MRVIAGAARGRPLKTVKGLAVRPTTDRVRESLFNVLQPLVAGSVFLDLFAGSGAVGIEALSRGADRAVFVEQAGTHLKIIADNLDKTGLRDRAELLRGDVLNMIPSLGVRGERFDLIFLDPPYGQDLVPRTLAVLAAAAVTVPGGVAVCEHHRKDPVPPSAGLLLRFRELGFGETVLSFYRHGSVEDDAGASGRG